MTEISEDEEKSLAELLEGYQSMLLSHEKRIGVIETLLVEAAKPALGQPQDHKKKRQ